MKRFGILTVAGLLAVALLAQTHSTNDGIYSKDQAARGKKLYLQECARCHSETLAGAEGNPALAGSVFMESWAGASVGELFDFVQSTMPVEDPGRLRPVEYASLVSYILSENGAPAGDKDMGTDSDQLKTIKIVKKQ